MGEFKIGEKERTQRRSNRNGRVEDREASKMTRQQGPLGYEQETK